MIKVLQINTTVNSGSTGRIAEEIGKMLLNQGHISYIVFGREERHSESIKIKIGNRLGQALHLIKTRILDNHGLNSSIATKRLIYKIGTINPDIINLHNLHGYYINYKLLIEYLKVIEIPIVWTLHDCWTFTGHCSHFERINCFKWQSECRKCPLKTSYPASYIIDRSKKNFHLKQNLFRNLRNVNIVTPSKWLSKHIKNSYLNHYPVTVINNGINLSLFKPLSTKRNFLFEKYNLPGKKTILGVANTWKGKRAFDDFLMLGKKLNSDYQIVLIGLRKKIIRNLPHNIIGIERTENIDELVDFYNIADAFINLTYADTIPTTNIESLACGTPVITYKTGGSPETIDDNTGIVVEKGNIEGILTSLNIMISKGKEHYISKCRERAKKFYNENDRFQEYIDLYKQLMNK